MKKPAKGILVAALLAALASPGTVAAHARLESSDPAARATLDRAPDSVRLRFNEEIEGEYSKIVVENEKREPVAAGAAQVSPDDPQLLILDLPTLPSGVYTVRFEVLSVDGHRVKKTFPFTVK
jgi:methionine-rich copper-binding protein CopC